MHLRFRTLFLPFFVIVFSVFTTFAQAQTTAASVSIYKLNYPADAIVTIKGVSFNPNKTVSQVSPISQKNYSPKVFPASFTEVIPSALLVSSAGNNLSFRFINISYTCHSPINLFVWLIPLLIWVLIFFPPFRTACVRAQAAITI